MAFNTFIARLLSHSENQPPAFQQFLLHSEQVWTCPGGVGPCTVTSKAPWAMVTCDPSWKEWQTQLKTFTFPQLRWRPVINYRQWNILPSVCLLGTLHSKQRWNSSAVLFSFSLTFSPVLKTTNYIFIVKFNFTQKYVEKHCFYACFMT